MALIETNIGAAALPEAPRGEPTAAGNDTIATLIYAIWRSRLIIMFTMALGIILGFFYGAIQLNVFAATGKLLLRVGIREGSTAETGVTPGSLSAVSGGRESMFTELELLASPALYRKVIETVGANRIVEFIDPTDLDDEDTGTVTKVLHRFQSWWFGASTEDEDGLVNWEEAALFALEMGLMVEPAGYSSVITVSYEGQDKRLAKEIVDAFMLAAEEFHRETFSTRAQLDFLNARLKDSRDKDMALAGRLIEYQKQWEIFDFDFQMAELLKAMAALQAKMDTAKDLRESLLQRKGYLDRIIEGKDEERSKLLRKIPNPRITELSKELMDWRRMKLSSNASGQSQAFEARERSKLIDQEIDRLRKEIAATPMFLSTETKHSSFLDEQYQIQSGLVTHTYAIKRQETRMALMKERLLELQGAQAQLLSLQKESKLVQQEVKMFAGQFDRLNLIGLLDEQKMGNLKVLQKAIMSRFKVAPRRGKFLVMGLILGFGIALVMAFARVLLDPLVRRPSELLRLTSRPTLAVIKEKSLVSRVGEERGIATVLQDTIWHPLISFGGGGGDRRFGIVKDSDEVDQGSVAASIALSLARWTGKSVIVLETGFDSPCLAQIFGVDSKRGLTHALDGSCAKGEMIQDTRHENLSVLAVGDGPRPSGGWPTSAVAKDLIRQVLQDYHYVICDLPPLESDPETRYFIDLVDAVVVTTRAGSSRKASLKSLVESLTSSGSPVVGVVMNQYRGVRPFWAIGTDPELQGIPS